MKMLLTLGAMVLSLLGTAQREVPVSYKIMYPKNAKTIVAAKGIEIYPNPSDGRFNIELKGFTEAPELQIYCMDDEKVVYQQKLETDRTLINLGKVARGIYVYRIYAPIDGTVLATGKLTFQ